MGDDTTQAETVRLPAFERRRLPARVTEILTRYILAEPLPEGMRLPSERQLAATLNVSRAVLREALAQLTANGLLVRASPRTLRVGAFDRMQVAASLDPLHDYRLTERHLMELRAVIEIGAVELVVQRATEADLREIERWVHEGERVVPVSENLLGQVDVRFHTALLRAAHNESIAALIPLLERSLYQNVGNWLHSIHANDHPESHRVAVEHRRIYEAIQRRDAASAHIVMLAHLSPYLRDSLATLDDAGTHADSLSAIMGAALFGDNGDTSKG